MITGASRGIGLAAAQLLGQAGAKVAIHYGKSADSAEKLAKELNNGSFAIQADLANPQEVMQLFEQATKQLGGLDVLVNNAGIAISSDDAGENDQWLADDRCDPHTGVE